MFNLSHFLFLINQFDYFLRFFSAIKYQNKMSNLSLSWYKIRMKINDGKKVKNLNIMDKFWHHF